MTDTRLSDRALLRLCATEPDEDVRAFLQGLVTQDMDAVQPGRPQWAGLLSAQGKRLFDFFLWADTATRDGGGGGDAMLIDCAEDEADALAKRLTLYRLRRRISIERDADLTVHWSLKGDEGNKGNTKNNPSLCAPDPRLSALGHRWLGDPQGSAADAAYRAHRLSLGVTEGADELGSDKTLWLECNAAELNGVSFAKGCYVGQENTARMNYRQKVNRRMVVVPLADANAKRQRIAYPDLGLSVEHRRVDDIPAEALPAWIGAGSVPTA